MKRISAILLLSLFFIACQKEEKIIEQPLAEQNMLDVSYGSDAAQRMDVYLPANRTATATKAIVIIHGGGWVSGDKADMNQFIPVLKQQLPGYAIFNINYRLGALPSSNPFPTQENDVKAAMNFIAGKAGDYVFNVNKLAVLGASAGGHLALLQAYKNASPKITAVVDLFGPTDIAGMHTFYASAPINRALLELLMGGTPASNAALYQSSGPINFVTAQSQPTLILHGTADDIVPISQSTALKTKLETNGAYVKMVTYTGAGHGDWNTTTMANAYSEIVSFLNAKNP